MAFIYNFQTYTGAPEQILETLRRSASALTRDCHEFCVGITSDGMDGIENRWYNTYRARNFTDMVPLYTTSSDNFRRTIERELVEFYIHVDYNGNRIGGGGGPTGPPPCYVYIARKY